ncbi:PREDICTED: uncharacterized protein K02A2.6-like [Gekko japonicus]|uniref:Gypsy retrotransposon integrase-like protein 1 n=1 Tax=Gekko japonicus TaxID=146911 RepID=A0ABM1KF51_GEKJA|nr:PREDICTED: uncharacterized protein K02A2.6-like [Gekko japonicus]
MDLHLKTVQKLQVVKVANEDGILDRVGSPAEPTPERRTTEKPLKDPGQKNKTRLIKRLQHYSCGTAVFDVAWSLVAPAEIKDVSLADLKLKGHFAPQPSQIASRHAFYKWSQAANETIAEYVLALRKAARPCNFSDLEEALLDRLICGMKDEKLQQRLFARQALTYAVAYSEAVATEAAEKATQEVRGQDNARSTDCHLTNCCSCPSTILKTGSRSRKKIHVTVLLNGVPCEMEVDSGSAVTVISSETLQHLFLRWSRQRLKPSSIHLSDFSVHRGCLLWGNRVVVPPKLRNQVLEALHECHPGIVRMKGLARGYFWWPKIDSDIESWVQRCHECQLSRPDPPQAPVQQWEKSHQPWLRVHINFAGPFQGQIFLIIVDAYSKWLEVVPTSKMMALTVINALRHIFATHGFLDTLMSDNGTCFTASEFQDFLAVASFLLHQHVTPHSVTGQSPVEMLMGRRLTTLLDRMHPDLTTSRLPHSESTDRTRGFEEGEYVYARNYAGGHRWLPATITKVLGSHTYTVRLTDGRVFKQHIDQLRKR